LSKIVYKIKVIRQFKPHTFQSSRMIDLFNNSLNKSENSGNKIIEIATSFEDFAKAEADYHKALTEYEKKQQYNRLFALCFKMGKIFREQADRSDYPNARLFTLKAIVYYKKAADVSEIQENHYVAIEANKKLALCYRARGRSKDADECDERAALLSIELESLINP